MKRGHAKTSVLVITARMTSERLPGKVIADIGGQPAIALMLRRLVGVADRIVVAVPAESESDAIIRAIPPGIATASYGHPTDLITRIAEAVDPRDATIGFTGADCPLTDPEIVRDAFATATLYRHVQTRGWPQGLNVQIVAREYLDIAVEHATGDERLYPNAYFDKRMGGNTSTTTGPMAARLLTRPGADEYPHRVTLDTPTDLRMLRAIVAECGPDVSAEQIIAWMHRNPGFDRETRGWNYHPDTSQV